MGFLVALGLGVSGRVYRDCDHPGAYVGTRRHLVGIEDYPLAGSATIPCAGGPDVIRKEAWPFYRTISGVRLCWELEEPKGPKGCGGQVSRVQGLGL